MRGFISYSRPRGTYGRAIFSVLFYFSYSTESLEISAYRDSIQHRYSCHVCGKWTTITIRQTLSLSEHRSDGKLELYRYDNVEPGDRISLYMRDSDLLYYQYQSVEVSVKAPYKPYLREASMFSSKLENPRYEYRDTSIKPFYNVDLLDWDEYLLQNPLSQRKSRIEEDLIQKTMKAEPITIKELVLEPAGQPLAIEGAKKIIEGTLKYTQ